MSMVMICQKAIVILGLLCLLASMYKTQRHFHPVLKKKLLMMILIAEFEQSYKYACFINVIESDVLKTN